MHLYLNGQPVDPESSTEKLSEDSDFITTFTVPYEAGTLQAVVGDANKTLETAGSPVAIRLTPDRSIIHADRGELAFVSVEVVDDQGRLVPSAQFKVSLNVQPGSAVAEVAGAGSGDPKDIGSFRSSGCVTWNGQCTAVLRPGTVEDPPVAGVVELQAKAQGLIVALAQIQVQEGGRGV